MTKEKEENKTKQRKDLKVTSVGNPRKVDQDIFFSFFLSFWLKSSSFCFLLSWTREREKRGETSNSILGFAWFGEKSTRTTNLIRTKVQQGDKEAWGGVILHRQLLFLYFPWRFEGMKLRNFLLFLFLQFIRKMTWNWKFYGR